MIRTNYFRLFILLFFTICLNSSVFAQGSKPHFEIKNAKDQDEAKALYNAVKEFDFEAYRFCGQRRIIHFVNSPVTIELFSAQELLDLYGRPFHSANITNNKPLKEISFEYFPQAGAAKAIIKN